MTAVSLTVKAVSLYLISSRLLHDTGSNPVPPTKYAAVARVIRRGTANPFYAGLIPVRSSNFKD